MLKRALLLLALTFSLPAYAATLSDDTVLQELDNGDIEGASRDADLLVKESPTPDNLWARAQVLNKKHDYAGAERDFSAMLASQYMTPGGFMQAYCGRAFAREFQHNPQGAMEDANECIKRFPDKPQGYEVRAILENTHAAYVDSSIDWTRAEDRWRKDGNEEKAKMCHDESVKVRKKVDDEG